MLFRHTQDDGLVAFADQPADASDASSEVVAKMIRETATHLPNTWPACKAEKIRKLLAAGATTDAALALLESALPRWKVCRLTYDDGEWYCALSRQRGLPDWLDEVIETRHQELPLTILKGCIEAALREQEHAEGRPVSSVPRIPFKDANLICCDNFI
jgi:hypothetical protein